MERSKPSKYSKGEKSPNFFPEEKRKMLDNMLREQNFEVEAKFKYVTRKQFYKIMKFLLNKEFILYNSSNTKVFYKDNDLKIVNLVDDSESYRTKKVVSTIDVFNWNYRITKAKEENIQFSDKAFDDLHYRKKDRKSFIDTDETSIFHGLSIDLTIVDYVDGNKSGTSYEIELEKTTRVLTQNFIDSIKTIYMLMQGYDNLFRSFSKKDIPELLKNSYAMDTEERMKKMKDYNTVIDDIGKNQFTSQLKGFVNKFFAHFETKTEIRRYIDDAMNQRGDSTLSIIDGLKNIDEELEDTISHQYEQIVNELQKIQNFRKPAKINQEDFIKDLQKLTATYFPTFSQQKRDTVVQLIERMRNQNKNAVNMIKVINSTTRSDFKIKKLDPPSGSKDTLNYFFIVSLEEFLKKYTISKKNDKQLRIYRNDSKNVKIDFLALGNLKNYAITSKLDGTRAHLFVSDAVYVVIAPEDIVRVSGPLHSRFVYIIDGELVGSSFYGFDVIYSSEFKGIPKLEYFVYLNENTDVLKTTADKLKDYEKKWIMLPNDIKKQYKTKIKQNKELYEKLRATYKPQSNEFVTQIVVQTFATRLDELNATKVPKSIVKFHIKAFYSKKSFYENINDAFDNNKKFNEKGIGTDGIVLQPIKEAYINDTTYKWKPSEGITIDFTVKNGRLYTQGKTGLEEFRGVKAYPYNKKLSITQFEGIDLEGNIVEFRWGSQEFTPIRFRFDRTIPNKTKIAEDDWKDIMKPIMESTIRGEDLIVMRRVHNIIKEYYIDNYVAKGSVILDIGSGRGGDLKKWADRGYKVYAVEPNKENVKEIEDRNKIYKANIKIINTTIQDTKTILENIDEQVDAVIAFFSLTFLQESSEIFNNFVTTVSRILKKEGMFIGIVLDGNKVYDFFQEKLPAKIYNVSEENIVVGEYDVKAKVIKSPAFTLAQTSDWTVPEESDIESYNNSFENMLQVNINDPTSMVKDVDEYLFYFEHLKAAMKTQKINIFKPNVSINNIRDKLRTDVVYKSKEEFEEDVEIEYEKERNKYENKFLDGGIDNLPENAKDFSRLNRLFIFQRANISTGGLITRTTRERKVDLAFFRSMIQIPIEDTPSSLVASISILLFEKFKELSPKEKIDFAAKCRRSIGNKLIIDEYKKLAAGTFAKNMNHKWQQAEPTTYESVAFSKFKDLVVDNEEWLPDTLEIIELLSNKLKINIFLIDDNSRDVYLPDADTILPIKIKCDILYKPERKSVVILSFNDGLSFQPLKTEDYSVFDPKDPLITLLHKRLCGEKEEVLFEYPFKKLSMTDIEVLDRFERLKRYTLDIETGKFRIANLPKTDPKLLKFGPHPASQYMRVRDTDYEEYDNISDYFNEECRVKCKRYDQEISSFEYWNKNREDVIKYAKKNYKDTSAHSLRESLYKLHYECTTFKPSLMVGLIKMFNLKSVLDISAGWGDRLIGALAANIDVYYGIDPNKCVHEGYKRIVKFLDSKTDVRLAEVEFEKAILPDMLFDGVISSPPYFNLETYSDEASQSIHGRNLEQWFNDFLMFSLRRALDHIRPGGVLIININNISAKEDYTIRMVEAVNKFKDVEYLGCLPQWTGDLKKSAQPFWIWRKKEVLVHKKVSPKKTKEEIPKSSSGMIISTHSIYDNLPESKSVIERIIRPNKVEIKNMPDIDIYLEISKLGKSQRKKWGEEIKTLKVTERAKKRFDEIKNYIPKDVKRYVDIGGGNCEISYGIGTSLGLKKDDINVFDIEDNCSPVFRDNVNFVLLKPLEKYPIADKSVDLVTIFQVLHHMDQDSALHTLIEIDRILKPGGVLIFREHDAIDQKNKELIDIEHMVYEFYKEKNVTTRKEARDIIKNYFAHYFSQQRLRESLENFGFIYVNEFDADIKNNFTKHYYGVYLPVGSVEFPTSITLIPLDELTTQQENDLAKIALEKDIVKFALHGKKWDSKAMRKMTEDDKELGPERQYFNWGIIVDNKIIGFMGLHPMIETLPININLLDNEVQLKIFVGSKYRGKGYSKASHNYLFDNLGPVLSTTYKKSRIWSLNDVTNIAANKVSNSVMEIVAENVEAFKGKSLTNVYVKNLEFKKVSKKKTRTTKRSEGRPKTFIAKSDYYEQEGIDKVFENRGWTAYDYKTSKVPTLVYEDGKYAYAKNTYKEKCVVKSILGDSKKRIDDKDALYKNLQKEYPDNKYMLPQYDSTSVKKIISKKKDHVWIVKPVGKGSYKGKGITIAEDNEELADTIKKLGSQKYVVSEYLTNPLLYGGKKFHIRVNVIIATDGQYNIMSSNSFLAIKSYSKEDFSDKDVHDTHFTTMENTKKEKDMVREFGKKWGDVNIQINEIIDVTSKLFVAEAWPECEHAFEVFGYDFIVDNKFKVYLMEINSKVGLGGDPEVLFNAVIDVTERLIKS